MNPSADPSSVAGPCSAAPSIQYPAADEAALGTALVDANDAFFPIPSFPSPMYEDALFDIIINSDQLSASPSLLDSSKDNASVGMVPPDGDDILGHDTFDIPQVDVSTLGTMPPDDIGHLVHHPTLPLPGHDIASLGAMPVLDGAAINDPFLSDRPFSVSMDVDALEFLGMMPTDADDPSAGVPSASVPLQVPTGLEIVDPVLSDLFFPTPLADATSLGIPAFPASSTGIQPHPSLVHQLAGTTSIPCNPVHPLQDLGAYLVSAETAYGISDSLELPVGTYSVTVDPGVSASGPPFAATNLPPDTFSLPQHLARNMTMPAGQGSVLGKRPSGGRPAATVTRPEKRPVTIRPKPTPLQERAAPSPLRSTPQKLGDKESSIPATMLVNYELPGRNVSKPRGPLPRAPKSCQNCQMNRKKVRHLVRSKRKWRFPANPRAVWHIPMPALSAHGATVH